MSAGDKICDMQEFSISVWSPQQSPTRSMEVAVQLAGVLSNPQHAVSQLRLDTSCETFVRENFTRRRSGSLIAVQE